MTASDRCRQCGGVNSPDTRFCVHCGAPFEPVTEPSYVREGPTTSFGTGYAATTTRSGPSGGTLAAIVIGGLITVAVAVLAVLFMTGVIGGGSDGGGATGQTSSPTPTTAAETEEPTSTPTEEPTETTPAPEDDYARLFDLIPNQYGPCEEETDPDLQEAGSIVTARCEPAEGIRTAWFDLFESRDEMDERMAQLVEDFGNPTGDDCEVGPSFTTWYYEDPDDVEGEILCFLDENNYAWLYWTEWDFNLMGSMYRRTSQFEPLYDFWAR